MNIEDIKGYSDDELRQIWWKLERNEIQATPYKIGKFILTENPGNGNEMTRKVRVQKLIGIEVQHRFMHGNLEVVKHKPVEQTADTTMDWVKKRITEIEVEYEAIKFDDCIDDNGTIVNTLLYGEKRGKGGKLKGYREVRDYLRTHLLKNKCI